METTALLLAAALLLASTSVAASVPGNVSLTRERLQVASIDFGDGVGITDPNDRSNPCTVLTFGENVALSGQQPRVNYLYDRGIPEPRPVIQQQPSRGDAEALAAAGDAALEQYLGDGSLTTNAKGLEASISPLRPPLSPPGGSHPNGGGINLGIPCPIPGSSSSNLWLVWDGMVWKGPEQASLAQLNLCMLKTFNSASPGCLPVWTDALRLTAAACGDGDPATPDWDDVHFLHDYQDQKGSPGGGVPWDTFSLKSDAISCPHFYHGHDYSWSLFYDPASFAGDYNYLRSNSATQSLYSPSGLWPFYVSQTYDMMWNANVVHPGAGTAYMVVCWTVEYLDFTNPLSFVWETASAHDWKLVIDLEDPLGPVNLLPALQLHLGGQIPGDGGVGINVALRGIYSGSPGDAGQNGDPCPASLPPLYYGSSHHDEAPTPLI